jgi:hypothetical protein
MSRPLMQLGVSDLESMFARSKTDAKVLKQIEHELQYRQVPRAVALLAEVQVAMYDQTPSASAPTRSEPAPALVPEQTGLMERPAPLPTPSEVITISATRLGESIKAPEPTVVPSTPPTALPLISVDDAYKLLKSTAGSSWESIEKTRRQMVLQSSPSITRSLSQDSRSQLLADAKRVNAAYTVITKHRMSTR